MEERGREGAGDVDGDVVLVGVSAGLAIASGSATCEIEPGKKEDVARGLPVEPAVCGRFGRFDRGGTELPGSAGAREVCDEGSLSECLRRNSLLVETSKWSERTAEDSLIEVSMLKGDTGCNDGNDGWLRNPSEGGGMIGAGAEESFLFLDQNELFLAKDLRSGVFSFGGVSEPVRSGPNDNPLILLSSLISA